LSKIQLWHSRIFQWPTHLSCDALRGLEGGLVRLGEVGHVVRAIVLVHAGAEHLLRQEAQHEGGALVDEQELAVHGVPGHELDAAQVGRRLRRVRVVPDRRGRRLHAANGHKARQVAGRFAVLAVWLLQPHFGRRPRFEVACALDHAVSPVCVHTNSKI
jgi:hypothetical protein